MKKILVFTYPFDQLERIVDYAVRFARDMNLPLEFVHVVEEPGIPVTPVDPVVGDFSPVGVNTDTVPNDYVENRSRILQKVLSIKNASMEFPISYSFKVVPGSLEALVSDIESRDDIEMVLVPNSEDSTTNRPVTEMIEGINKPVFAFPLEKEYHPIRKIVYATDFNEHDVSILKKTASLARHFMAKITVFHVNKKKKYEEILKTDGLQDKLAESPELRNIEVTVSKSDKIVSGIKEFSRRNYADLVVLLRENKNFWQELFGNSTTKELVKEARVPVLIYHES